jgi:uncharacterized membrane protein
MDIQRLIRHARTWMRLKPVLSEAELQTLSEQVAAIEAQHLGEVRICVEHRWPLSAAASGLSVRARALQVFAELAVWDTEDNTGLLIYLDVADRAIEIVADRGLNSVVAPDQWQAVLAPMQAAFTHRAYAEGLHACLSVLDTVLRTHLPAVTSPNHDELSNTPFIR